MATRLNLAFAALLCVLLTGLLPVGGVAAQSTDFPQLAPGATLPSDCATRVVRSNLEHRPENNAANAYQAVAGSDYTIETWSGTNSAGNQLKQRIAGEWHGTTEDMLRYYSCKWGLHTDRLRGQAWKESTWIQSTRGDYHDGGSRYPGTDYQSYSVAQVKRSEWFVSYPASQKSTAFGLDWLGWYLRICLNGQINYFASTYKTDSDRWRGCAGSWFSGKYFGGSADETRYLSQLDTILQNKPWTTLSTSTVTGYSNTPAPVATPLPTPTPAPSNTPPSTTAGTLLVQDDFNRANGLLGTAPTGQVWVNANNFGTGSIANNRASISDSNISAINTGQQDVIACARLMGALNGFHLIVRHNGGNNGVLISAARKAGRWHIAFNIGGEQGTGVPAGTDDRVCIATLNGTAYLYVNDQLVDTRPLGTNPPQGTFAGLVSTAGGSQIVDDFSVRTTVAAPPASPCVEAAAAALTKKGAPYVWGAKGPNEFDCSGLTYWAYQQAGIEIGLSTYHQVNDGVPIGCTLSDLKGAQTTCWQPGDLMFLKYPDGQHVSIYVGNGLNMDCYNPTVDCILHDVSKDSGYQRYWWQARRIVADCEGALNPTDPSTPSGDPGWEDAIPDLIDAIEIIIPQCEECGGPNTIAWQKEPEPVADGLGEYASFKYWFSWLGWKVRDSIRALVCTLLAALQLLSNGVSLGFGSVIRALNRIYAFAIHMWLGFIQVWLAIWAQFEMLRLTLHDYFGGGFGLGGVQAWLDAILGLLTAVGDLLLTLLSMLRSVVSVAVGLVGYVGGLLLGGFTALLGSNTETPSQLTGTDPVYYIVHGFGRGLVNSQLWWLIYLVWGMCYAAFFIWIAKFFSATGDTE
jgi:hypothetical protein